MPWPLPNRVTKTICIVAGRDASSALCIALGKHTAASVAHETTYHEPFTYWDWHGVHPDDTYAREWKRQRIWEHQRSFTVDGLHVLGYPTSRERWIRFQESMESHPTRRKWVKRIAVAHWMGSEDLLWIAKNLSELIALDLSDAPIVDTYGQHTWTAFFGPAILGPPAVASKLLGELEWLGLPDFCNHHHDDVASQLVTVVLGHCSSLLTLSIRSRQSSDDNTNPHDYVCKLPSMIASYGSLKLERLELRLPFLCLEALMAGLVKGGSEIRHIGIDLGAWIQLHPKGKKATNDLKESDVRKAARSAAKKQRFDIYEDAHKERFPAEERRRLPESQIESHTAGHTWLYSKNAKHAFENDFYNTDRQSMSPPVPVLTKDHDAAGCEYFDQDRVDDLKRSLSEADPSTLPEMLDDLHRAARNNPNFKLFALEPEWQENSIDPLHPFALIQQPASATSSPASRKSAAPGLNQDVYEWLNKTLKWRPVFDWDSLVRCKDPGHDKAYQQLWNRYGLDSSLSTCQDANAEIAEQLQLLRSAGIPIHILFGRRHTDTSSLYWGWPCDDNAWSKWLAAPFSANIGLIAPLVDTLSIMYDLRDPIEPSSPFGVSSSTCPRPVCPWARVKKTCPYKIQWNPAPISPRGQKLANKHLLRTPPVSKPLAPHIHTLPLPESACCCDFQARSSWLAPFLVHI
ncbi:hypothetical protein DE146DRAFT_675740 [Phaeosphaeria sp. MPI-PUGE-AT-0046c]|nr:hypothetical protein DE146DRAFT_675740 [Phaeosphaeria sp. MPI-PUGE-AT-0046c]